MSQGNVHCKANTMANMQPVVFSVYINCASPFMTYDTLCFVLKGFPNKPIRKAPRSDLTVLKATYA